MLELNNRFLICHQNIRSLRKNFDHFVAEINSLIISPDIIILTEIWINNNETGYYTIPNYKAIFQCNEIHRAGGIVVFINMSFRNIRFKNIECETADLLLVSFEIFKTKFSLCSVYRLQSFTADAFVNELNQIMNDLNNEFKNLDNLLWVGDVNINILNVNRFNVATDEYNLLMTVNGLECILKEPTRVTEHSETCIDHVFARVRNKSLVSAVASVKHVGLTDHAIVEVSIKSGSH